MQIELAYIFADQQNILVLELSQGTTIAQVLTNLPDPDAYTSACAVGIFGRIRSKNWIVQEGDRIEIYRPLLVDPKAARLARAKKQKKSNF